jgi:glycosyltransferase involved in cell wall biosynthesis
MTAVALRLPADVLFASSTPLTIAIPALVRQVVRRTPFVFEARDLWPEVPFAVGALSERSPFGRLANGVARHTYKRSSAVVALSSDMADGIMSHGVQPRKVVVATNAADRSLTSVPRDAGSDDLDWFRSARHRYIYGGTVGRVNDVAWLIRVFSRCVDEHGIDARLLVVGDGGGLPDVYEEIERASSAVKARIRVLRRRPKIAYIHLLRTATMSFNLFAPLPALAASSPNKVFDSFVCGTPVASNQGGWLARMVEEFQAGVNLPRDETEAAACLARLDGVGVVGDLRRGALDAADVYTWDRTVEQIVGALEFALRGRGLRAQGADSQGSLPPWRAEP